jgi:hypothetical protein
VDYAGEGTYAAVGVLPPGLQLLAGVGWRTTGGELGFEARATGLSAQGGAFGYQGQVGGVGAVATWRVVY